MTQSQTPLSLKRALALSTGLHLLLAPLFVTSLALFVGAGIALSPSGTVDQERLTVSTITFERRVRHEAPSVKRPASEAPHTIQRRSELSARVAQVHVAPRARVLSKAAPKSVEAVTEEAPPVALAPVGPVAPPRAAEATTTQAMPVSTPSPVPTASSSPAAVVAAAPTVQTVAARGYDGPVGGWGQNFEKPIVADEASLNDLRARFHSSLSVSIAVDENGKATRISIPGSVPSDERSELEHRLSGIRYVPAECNGLRCAGTLQILL